MAKKKKDSLKAAVEEFHTAREEHGQINLTLREKKEAWESKHSELIKRVDAASERMHSARRALDEEMLRVYESTGNNHPGPGLDIRIRKEVEYDEDEAIAWARENAPFMLSLDHAVYKLVAQTIDPQHSGQPARIVDTPTTAVAKDLTNALAEL